MPSILNHRSDEIVLTEWDKSVNIIKQTRRDGSVRVIDLNEIDRWNEPPAPDLWDEPPPVPAQPNRARWALYGLLLIFLASYGAVSLVMDILR